MTRKLLTADAVAKIVSRETGQVVGMVYRWNTGRQLKGWFGNEHQEVEIVPLQNDGGYVVA